jgi:hypothetical protein
MVPGGRHGCEACEPLPAKPVEHHSAVRLAGAVQGYHKIRTGSCERGEVLHCGCVRQSGIVVVERQRVRLAQIGDFGISCIFQSRCRAAVEVQLHCVRAGAAGDLGVRGIRHRDKVVALAAVDRGVLGLDRNAVVALISVDDTRAV